MRRPQPARWIIGLLSLACLVQGCATSRSMDSRRLVRYRPDSEGRTPSRWAVDTEPESETTSREAAPRDAETASSREGIAARTLKRGGKVSIYLRGIPASEEIIEVIDDLGAVRLPLIGSVIIAGLTSSEAEEKIAAKYIESGYYKKITVNVVAEKEEYFVRGEVKQEGAYPIGGDLSLLRAITAAGGYTDYAKIKQVKVIRKGTDPQVFDAGKIERGQKPDPLIEPGDIIVVPRRFW